MKVLSLFDGMACGMLAMMNADIQVDRYVAFEIDKYAVQTSSHNFPSIEHRGDVFNADFSEFVGFDYLIGGSPCTYWSIAQKNNRETEASGMGWELFSQYVRALNEAKPRFFIYENNKSMSAAIRESITEAFGFEPICINSALVSAQNRQRLYWVGKRNDDGTYSKVNIEQPEDIGILLKDILVSGNDLTSKDKSFCLTATYDGACPWNTIERSQRTMVAEPINTTADGKAQCIRATCYKDGIRNVVANDVDRRTGVAEPVRVGCFPSPDGTLKNSQAMRLYSTEGKSVNITAQGGGLGAKTGLYVHPICHTIQQEVRVRKYSCDILKLQALLRQSKQNSKLTNLQIAERLEIPQTEVEHWFRTDKYFNIPDEDIWFDLKKLLEIESIEFDDFVTVFEEREGVFEKANRCYDANGKMSTIMTGKTDNIIGSINYGYATASEWDENGKPTKAIAYADGKSYTVYEVKDGQITIKGKQVVVRTPLDYFSFVHDADLIRVLDCAQTVCDCNGCTALHKPFKCFLHKSFAFGIQC